MNEVQKTLIALFSRLSVAEIDAEIQHLFDAFKVTTYEELKALQDYEEEYKRARNAKVEIERIGNTYDLIGDQALQYLDWLRIQRGKTVHESQDYVMSCELLARTLHTRWPAPDWQKFEQRRAVLDQWSDVFISYTNRDGGATNMRYRRLIGDELGWPVKSKARKANYLARVLAKFFEQQGIRGFVDFKSLQCGDDLKAVILARCATTIAFVQLVENVTLTEPLPPDENWCHLEFEAFVKAALPVPAPANLGNRCFFVLAGGPVLARPQGMGNVYEPWFQRMAAMLHIVIDSYKQRPPDELREKITGIARQIVNVRNQIVDSMLEAWA